MFLGSVGSGILMGLTGALMTWIGGHPFAAVIIAYAVLGSLGTLFVAAIGSLRHAEVTLPRR